MANRKLNSIKFPDIADTYILDADKVNYDGSETYASGSVGEALQNKANIDGSYEGMTVGNAEQLVSNVRVNDKTPYLFRTSGGSVDIGDREYANGIVGGTVAWNQLCDPSVIDTKYGITVTKTNNVFTFSGTATASAFFNFGYPKKDHVMLLDLTFDSASPTYPLRQDGYSSNINNSRVYKHTGANVANYYLYVPNGSAISETVRAQIFDLTQMFGSTIADYIYSLETATAGAGVAWFKKLFNKPYYAYNAGELKSVSGVSAHNMTGFNQWDEEWESGAYDTTTGAKISYSGRIRNKNLIPVLPNTTYYIKAPANNAVYWKTLYDADKNFVKTLASSANATFNIPSDVYYMAFYTEISYGSATYNNDICVNLAWDNSRNGEYEPYELHSYPLDSTLTLRGIPKLDANNNLYYDGDVYEPDGTVTRKYGIVDLGTLAWSATTYAGVTMMSTSFTAAAHEPGEKSGICSKYEVSDDIWTSLTLRDKLIGMNYAGSVMYAYDSDYTDAATFKTAMSGVYLVYELAEPTEETADPYQTPQIVNDFGTEEFVIDSNTFAVPVGHDTEYPVNLVAKLEMAPNSPEGDGDYIVRQTNGTNEYVPLVIEDALPTIPSTAGTYKLTVTVASGSDPVLSWEAE